MKKLLKGLLILLVILVSVLAYNTFTFNRIDYSPLSERVYTKSHPQILAEALTHETISHKPEMIDREAFLGLHQSLKKGFPLVDSLLEITLINDYSLIYKWSGTQPDLQPVVLVAHQDVVPVEYASLDHWDEAPFSGTITKEYLYGRGAIDDKGNLVAIYDAAENLLQQGFEPQRDIYLCFGHDEEIGGEEGAVAIVKFLKENGIKPWAVLDEGGQLSFDLVPGINDSVALIGTSEKGYLSLELSVNTPGGHSSMPEQVNAIAVLNKALFTLQNNPLPYRISQPMEDFILHVGPHLEVAKKMAFANVWLFKGLIYDAYKKKATSEALIHTTQVTTILNAGIKDNVVPSRAKAVLNYRLLPGDEPEFIVNRAKELINDSLVSIKVHQNLSIPASPVSAADSEQFRTIAGAVKAINPNSIVTPYLVIAATDGRHYYEITDHVYRFSPFPLGPNDIARIHGVNERVSLKAYSQAVDFYATLIYAL